MLWSPTTYLQTCIQIGVLDRFQFYGWQYVSETLFLRRARPPEAPLCWDVLALGLSTSDKTDNLDISMLWGDPSYISWQGRWRACEDVGPICNLSAGPVMYGCGLDGHSRAVCCCSVCHGTQGTSTLSPSLQVPHSPPPCATHLLLHWFS